jgi:hypothetical protein
VFAHCFEITDELEPISPMEAGVACFLFEVYILYIIN